MSDEPKPGPLARFFAGVTLREIIAVLVGLGIIGGSHVVASNEQKSDDHELHVLIESLATVVDTLWVHDSLHTVVNARCVADIRALRRQLRARGIQVGGPAKNTTMYRAGPPPEDWKPGRIAQFFRSWFKRDRAPARHRAG